MSDERNRPDSKFTTDDWFTPPCLLREAGHFDMDPACHRNIADDLMPAYKGMRWPKADRCVALPEDGLALPWTGRVWLNPPYSNILPWAQKLAEHGNGLFLVPAKSPDTAWGQFTLATASAVMFIKGRLLFWYPDGTESAGKWSPSMLCAYGNDNVDCLFKLKGSVLPGLIYKKIS